MDNPDGALQQDATIDACNVNPEPENAIDTEVRRVTTSQSSKHSSTVEERPFTSEETPLLHSENGSTAEEIPSLPWWRTPSVHSVLVSSNETSLTLSVIDVLDPPRIHAWYPRFRWGDSPFAESDT